MNAKAVLKDIAKCLAHGAIFSILIYAVGWFFGYLTSFLALIGALLGLILSFVLLMLVWGIVNSLIARLLWFPVEKGWKAWLGQGFSLALALGILGIPLILALPYMARLPYDQFVILLVVLAILYSLLDGFIAMRVARHWKMRGIGVKVATEGTNWTPDVELQPDNPNSLHCPRCGSTKMIVAKDNSALCLECQRGVRSERMGGTAG
ncbi:MAG TPA: hypothetical protein VEY12_08750 [Thermoplasmata archaeon]|nr:hypothetical protein [Thermoplasmata archaeon]